MSIKRQCPVCENHNFIPCLSYKNIPTLENRTYSSTEEASNVQKGDLELILCSGCGFVFNNIFESSKVDYSDQYDNKISNSFYYDNHINHVLNMINQISPIETSGGGGGTRILEVGCGKGSFLEKIYKKYSCICYGYDPCIPANICQEKKRDTVSKFNLVNQYFDADEAEKFKQNNNQFDWIISRHVIEHLENPQQMLQLFYSALSPNGYLYVETPRLNWILDNLVVYDFPYEHCSYFSDSFIEYLLMSNGFEIEKIEHTYNGQYFSICAKKSVRANVFPIFDNSKIIGGFKKLSLKLEDMKQNLHDFVVKRHLNGKVCLWGASAKGVISSNLFDPDKALIDFIVDINPDKQGQFIPGTGHLIVSPSDLFQTDCKTVIVENDNYFDEITQILHEYPDIKVFRLNQVLTGNI